MLRTIIRIDEEKCDGCGLCVDACHEGAIGLVDGKAKLLRDDYCDGFGDCLPACPMNAISFEEREAAAYDEAGVQANLAARKAGEAAADDDMACGCPGSEEKVLLHPSSDETAGVAGVAGEELPCGCPGSEEQALIHPHEGAAAGVVAEESVCRSAGDSPISQLAQWPTQIKLVSPTASFFDGAKLLVAADCCAYAFAGFHECFMRGHVTLIGCPKLDNEDYAEKLTEIISRHDIKSVIVARMEVPCCAGIVNAVKEALARSGKQIPCNAVTFATNGEITP